MGEIQKNQTLHRDPTLINLFYRDILHPLLNHYTHIPFVLSKHFKILVN